MTGKAVADVGSVAAFTDVMTSLVGAAAATENVLESMVPASAMPADVAVIVLFPAMSMRRSLNVSDAVAGRRAESR